jgi:uncharacterized repeat protein (TIGR01451 family)
MFLAFDLSKVEPRCADAIVSGALDWFSPVTRSTIGVDRPVYASGDTVPIAIRLVNDGPRDLTGVVARWTFPTGGTPADLPAGPQWQWLGSERTLVWRGDLARGRPVEAAVDFLLNANLAQGAAFEAQLAVDDGSGIVVRRGASWRANVADLSSSAKTVTILSGRPWAERGDQARFTISLRNRGTVPVSRFIVTDTLPSGLRLLERTVTLPQDTTLLDLSSRGVVWQGAVGDGAEVSLSFDVEVTAAAGGNVLNVAQLDDGSGAIVPLPQALFVRPHLHLPWIAAKATLPRR